jgi:hypothetical protein
MKRISTLTLLTCLFAAVLAQAQMPMPTPASELKKLNYFVGTWTAESDLKASPMGPGGKETGTSHAEWMEGNFFLVSHGAFSGVMGKGSEVFYMGYDGDQKVYTYTEFSSTGEHDVSKGTLDGDTWTWNSEENMGGQKMKGRFTMKILSPTAYAYKFEISQDGSTWSTVMDGKATKTK